MWLDISADWFYKYLKSHKRYFCLKLPYPSLAQNHLSTNIMNKTGLKIFTNLGYKGIYWFVYTGIWSYQMYVWEELTCTKDK